MTNDIGTIAIAIMEKQGQVMDPTKDKATRTVPVASEIPDNISQIKAIMYGELTKLTDECSNGSPNGYYVAINDETLAKQHDMTYASFEYKRSSGCF